jgi:hypothetical protein
MSKLCEASIDLRKIYVMHSTKPPEVFGVKELYNKGDAVISIGERTDRGNAIIMYYRDSSVCWSKIIKRRCFGGGIVEMIPRTNQFEFPPRQLER